MASQYQLFRMVTTLLEERIRTVGTTYPDTTILETAALIKDEWARKTEYMEEIHAFPLFANQGQYLAPTDLLEVKHMSDDVPTNLLHLRYVPPDRWQELQHFTTAGTIYYFTLWKNRFKFYPIPNVSSPSTTLSVQLDPTDSSISLTADAGFPRQGYFLINGELIRYQALSGTSAAPAFRAEGSTTLPRAGGLNGSHPIGSLVQLCQVVVHMYRKARFTERRDIIAGATETALVNQGNALVVGTNTTWGNAPTDKYVGIGDYIGFGDSTVAKSEPLRFYRIKEVDRDNQELKLGEPYRGQSLTASKFVISPPVFGDDPHASEYLNTIAHGTAAQLLRTTGHTEKSEIFRAEYQSQLMMAKADKNVRQLSSSYQFGDPEDYPFGPGAFPTFN